MVKSQTRTPGPSILQTCPASRCPDALTPPGQSIATVLAGRNDPRWTYEEIVVDRAEEMELRIRAVHVCRMRKLIIGPMASKRFGKNACDLLLSRIGFKWPLSLIRCSGTALMRAK